MSVQQRLAKLEQTQTGDSGAGVWGVCRVDHLTGTGPDEVRVGTTGETMTEVAFNERYPRGLLIERQEYGSVMGSGLNPRGSADLPGTALPTRRGGAQTALSPATVRRS